MNSPWKQFVVTSRVLVLTIVLTTLSSAQGPPAEPRAETGASTSSSAPNSSPATDDNWHLGITPYLWFAGVHGTSGALGHQLGVHASFSDIFKYFNIGFMGAVEARKKRVVTYTDVMWMRLSDEKALPLNDLGVQSADVKIREFLITPMVGYRVVDRKIKVDAMVDSGSGT